MNRGGVPVRVAYGGVVSIHAAGCRRVLGEIRQAGLEAAA